MITKIVHSGARKSAHLKAHVYNHHTMPSIINNIILINQDYANIKIYTEAVEYYK